MSQKEFSRFAKAAAILLPLVGAGCAVNNGTGTANGYVTITKTSGWFWRTHEGEMALGNMRSARSSSGGNTFDFNVQDPTVWKKLIDAQNNQTPVQVSYHEVSNPWPWTQDNDDVIDSVTPLKEPVASPFGYSGASQSDDQTYDNGAVNPAPPARGNTDFLCRPVSADLK
ncbi:MAG: hypothetical protein WCD70_04605 [Alphaproteobacteria bacterium]